MKMNQLGRTGIEVSELCLGTMTWPTHTPTVDAHAQMEVALDHGINFIDTAEMYPVGPALPETAGQTEETMGEWFKKTGRRDEWVVATKIGGVGGVSRNGEPITGKNITSCIEESLQRLQTDYIDLYQLHWPNRGTYAFRRNWTYNPGVSRQTKTEVTEHIDDCLDALDDQIKRGTIRAFGLSNETAWGTANWLSSAERSERPRVATLQNEYSLLCRLADTDLAELTHFEGVSLLAYSPLAMGLLTGKYQDDVVPERSRRTVMSDLGGRVTPRSFAATQAYVDLAEAHSIDVAHMALAWSARRPFVASSIFGATNVGQLQHLVQASDCTLDDELLSAIDDTHRSNPFPF